MADTPERAEPLKGLPVPKGISDKIKRGKEAKKADADIRRQCVKFWQNEPYWYVKAAGGLGVLPTAFDAVDKANYRIRKKLNLIPSMVQRKVSAASQRIPGFEVDPSSIDQDDVYNAAFSQQVLFYGYEEWRWRRMTVKGLTNALVQREGFAYPYYDTTIGPYTKNKDGEWEGRGDIRFLSLSRDEVIWEPGVDFEESRWYGIVRGVLVEHIKKIPGFVGGSLEKNGEQQDLPEGKTSGEMAELIEYLERPCSDYPDGRRIFIAQDKQIVNWKRVEPDSEYTWEPYPYRDRDDKVIDKPCLHRVSYTVDPEGDDRGLVELLIDPQTTMLDCWNKILELKNRALHLQMIAPRGSNMSPREDQPGATYYYNPIGGQPPQWEPAPDPQYLAQLVNILEQVKMEMRAIAGDIDIQPEPDLAAKTLNAAIEQAQAQWQVFLGDVAAWHASIAHHCLTLVQRHYDRDRKIQIRGQYGWEPDASFSGADLSSNVNVRVLPGSIETKTRSTVMQEIQFVQTMWPNAISPEVALAAIHGGNAEGLFKTYDLHVARAWSLVQKIRNDYTQVLNMPPRQDLEFGDPTQDFMIPGWMPRKQDNLVIWKQVIGDYMITPDYDDQDDVVRQIFDLVWDGLEHIEQMKLMKMQAQEMSAAAQQGEANAAKPQGDIPPPAVNTGMQSPNQADPAAMTPE